MDDDQRRHQSEMKTVLLVVLAVGVVLGMLWIVQRRFIYFPEQEVPDATSLPLTLEEVRYPTEDGLHLTAWFSAPSAASRGTVLIFNGNAGNRYHRLPLAEALNELGYATLLVDYRGYGGNPGTPSEEGLARDAKAAHAYLKGRPDVDPDRLVYFGESLGAAVAVGLASQEPPAALVLRSPFTSLAAVGAVHYPFLPVAVLLWDTYPNLEAVTGIEVPILVIAGSNDTIIPAQQSREVFEAAPGPKSLLEIPEADHNDYSLLAGNELIQGVTEFLNATLPLSE